MLRAYGPGCDGGLLDAGKGQRIPDGATWIDLEEPTHEEDKLVERCLGVAVPTRDDMSEIEPSSRLYDRAGTLYMTLSVLYGVEEGHPKSDPMTFVLTSDRLVTVRYVTPKPVRSFEQEARREPALVKDALSALHGLLDAMVDRLADELEGVSRETERLSSQIFARDLRAERISADRLTSLLTRIGRTQTLLAKVRETTVSGLRLLAFLSASEQLRDANGSPERFSSLSTDAHALVDYSSFLGDNLTFLLDASLGLISVEQNAAMKVFSWVAVVFMPPTLIAGIFGMNFHYMPELDWRYGYPAALAAILVSAIVPFWIMKKRGWI